MNSTNTETIALTPLRRLAVFAAAATLLCLVLAALAGRADAAFGISSFDGEVTTSSGGPAEQAGSHPYKATTTIKFNTTTNSGGATIPDGAFKTVETRLPPGLIGNPHATPKCRIPDFLAGEALALGNCPNDTAVGVGHVTTELFGGTISAPVYNLQPGPNQAARFGFHILTASIFLNVSVRTGGDYGLTITIPNSSQGLPILGTGLELWGVPANPSHDGERGKCEGLFGPSGESCPSGAQERAFLTNPTSCTGPVSTGLRVDSWQEPNSYATASFLSHDTEGKAVGATGCERLPFEPSFEVAATPGSAASPSSLDVSVHIPQHEGLEELASSQLRKAVVTLPQGVTVNAAAANGLAACSEAQIDVRGPGAVGCPDASKIGTTEILSPLLEEPLKGGVYLAKQGENEFGSLLAIYAVAEAEGVLIKLPGKLEADASTGQVTATFGEDPQLPFSDVRLSFFGGSSGVLSAPGTCGTYTATGTFTPWSGSAPVTKQSSFAVTSGPNGSACPKGLFEPQLRAGTVNPVAGRYSNLSLTVSREDGAPALTGLDVKLPKGLLAKLAGVKYCPQAVLAAIPTGPGTGAAQLASPSCPADSQVGTVAVSAGTGPTPLYLDTGRAYLAGPYKGAPLSLALVTPALAGPLDLGNVVVRAALKVNPVTAQVEAVSDPIPTMLSGIPLALRDIRVTLNRKRFTLNPTTCDPSKVLAKIAGSGGAAATASNRFQVGACGRLGFSPRLSLALKGGTGRAQYPALTATVAAKPGQANLARVSVALPHSEFLAQEHIQTVCTRKQFAAGHCPKGSVYGYASAYSPLLAKPLRGPVYLRSSSNPLPDLVVALHGQIDVDLDGRIDSVGGGIRTTFQTIPDAPITKFVLAMKGGDKSLLVNSRDLCAAGAGRATARVTGQNGKTANQRPALSAGCGTKG
ncbi:MAG TPA: hypothetical protein VF731_01220 [Solirubrobacterales bacterium]